MLTCVTAEAVCNFEHMTGRKLANVYTANQHRRLCHRIGPPGVQAIEPHKFCRYSPFTSRSTGLLILKERETCLEPPKPPFDLRVFLTNANGGKTSTEYRTNDSIFLQGRQGKRHLLRQRGQSQAHRRLPAAEGIGGRHFEGWRFLWRRMLGGQKVRMTTAVAVSTCSVMKLEKAVVLSLLHEEPSFSELFLAHLLSRSIRLEEDLVAHLFHSSEKRLA
jgi:hypothetical protein